MCGIVRSVVNKPKRLLVAVLVIGCFSLACTTSTSGESATSNGQEGVAAIETSPGDCTEFQSLVDKTYDFKPTKLSEAQQTAKSAEMDVIWEKVKADKKLLPCLRTALESPKANAT